MRVVVQRVASSQVRVGEAVVGRIGRGLNLLVGFGVGDTSLEVAWMAQKCLGLRLFPGEGGDDRWQRSIVDIQGELLVVSQFTLYGDCQKGRRPGFDRSAAPGVAGGLYEEFVGLLRASGLRVETGQFGAMMEVSIVNDGPVTLIVER